MDSRNWLTARFCEALTKISDEIQLKDIAVLGGGPEEPELQSLKEFDTQITYLGIENTSGVKDFFYLDLDNVNNFQQKFDLVICNQVIEHLFNLQNAFATIGSLVNHGGILWITAPANNFRHGSPHFYSAGYSKEFLEKNLEGQKFVAVEFGELSSKRVYMYRHLLQLWPTEFQIDYPLFAYFGTEGSILRKIIYNVKSLPVRILISLSSKKWEINGKFPVETFGLFKKLH